MGKASFTPLHIAFTAPASAKLATAQRGGVEISYTEFHPNRSRNMDNMKWKFIYIPKDDCHRADFPERHRLRQLTVTNLRAKFDENWRGGLVST